MSPVPADHVAARWQANWIWADAAPSGERHVVALATRFDLETVPKTAPTRWCAISRAAVFVNGREVGRGPVRSNPRRQPYEDLDLSPHLTAGTNHIAVLAWNYAGATPWYLPMPPFASDLANGAFVFESHIGDRIIGSDDTWSATVLAGWGATRGGGVAGRGAELIDLRSLPADWATGGLEGSSITRRAFAVGEPTERTPPSYPIGPFGGRPIAPLTNEHRPMSDAGDGTWRADEILAGTLAADVEGPAGATVTLRIAEMVDADGTPLPGEHDASLRIVCDGARRSIGSLDRFGGQGVVVEAEPGVTIHAVAIDERLYPVAGAAAFACSDPLLERIHQVGRRSVTLNSDDAYTDCPTREQRAWTGDSVVHQLVDLTTNEDWALARRNTALIAGSIRPDGMLPMAVAGDAEEADFTIIPDWALHWIHSVWNLYRYIGDREEIAGLLPVVEQVLRWFEPFRDRAGLLRDVYGWVIIDWSSVHTEGASAALNGLYGRALVEFAEMSTWLGDRGRASWATARHDDLRVGFEAFWDPVRRRYVDSIVGANATAEGERCTASEHAQAAAIVGQVVPDDRVARLVHVLEAPDGRVHATFSVPDGPAEPNSEAPVGGAYLRAGHPEPWWDIDGLVVAQPFFSSVVHDALAEAGRANLIPARCRRWEIALERCPTSWTETWFGGTISHGWSSTPTRDLMQRTLGVTPAEPGFAVASIEPALGDLTWASGAVPTGRGLIRVRAEPHRLEVDSPVPFVHADETFAAGHHIIETESHR